jgi:hypothetical protein
VNTKSKVFHREGDRWYGKTKEGTFMTEADALWRGIALRKKAQQRKAPRRTHAMGGSDSDPATLVGGVLDCRFGSASFLDVDTGYCGH